MKQKAYSHELIGRTIEVIGSPNLSLRGLKGNVVDETKSTVRIVCGGKIRVLLKGSISFRVIGSNLVIHGRDIVKRPEERIKGK